MASIALAFSIAAVIMCLIIVWLVDWFIKEKVKGINTNFKDIDERLDRICEQVKRLENYHGIKRW